MRIKVLFLDHFVHHFFDRRHVQADLYIFANFNSPYELIVIIASVRYLTTDRCMQVKKQYPYKDESFQEIYWYHEILLDVFFFFLRKFCHGSTPLIKLSIETHSNIVLRDYNSTPHVTMFWKFCWQKLLKQRLNFNLSLLWWCRSR